MLEKIWETSRQFLKIKNSPYRRYLIRTTKFNHRMCVIVGQRGIGKTTTLIQLLLDKVKGDLFDERILYIQADHFVLGSTTLYEIAQQFELLGGKWMAIDEIHKYPDWSRELKSIYDTFPTLNLIISGSSALEIYKGSHDLIRRAVRYTMQGLSFREYLELAHNLKLPTFSFADICNNHEKLSEKIINQIQEFNLKVLPEFYQYLKVGYYPYYFEIQDEDEYKLTLEQNLHMTIESDLAAIYPHLTGASIKKIKQLMIFIANSVPFVPNWDKLRIALEIGDVRTLKSYFKHLEDARLVRSLLKATNKFSQLESPEKLYLDNPNQLYAISSIKPDKGTVREIFFLNNVSQNQKISAPRNGDFLVNDEYLFEVGGRKKNFNQIKSHSKAFLCLDDIEHGIRNKIPLWLFGFLY